NSRTRENGMRVRFRRCRKCRRDHQPLRPRGYLIGPSLGIAPVAVEELLQCPSPAAATSRAWCKACIPKSRLFGNRCPLQYAHGESVLSISINLFLNELHLGKLSETVIVHGNTPHNRPRFLVSHLIGNRASLLCTKAPMLRGHNKVSGWHQISGCSCVTCVDCEWPVVLLVET